jgi:hypothetical protein
MKKFFEILYANQTHLVPLLVGRSTLFTRTRYLLCRHRWQAAFCPHRYPMLCATGNGGTSMASVLSRLMPLPLEVNGGTNRPRAGGSCCCGGRGWRVHCHRGHPQARQETSRSLVQTGALRQRPLTLRTGWAATGRLKSAPRGAFRL